MAIRLKDGSIRMSDGRIIYADTTIQGRDLLEIVPLLSPPAWPFVSGGGGARSSGGSGGPGDPADPGAQGAQGNQGIQGPSLGPIGPQGGQGVQGRIGNQGVLGPQGLQGAPGTQGNTGVQGPQGNQGIQGNFGPQGSGVQGPQGLQGPQGNQGSQGNFGPQGQGVQGPQGTNPGPQGSQGPISSLTTLEASAAAGGTTGTMTMTFVPIGATISFTLATPMAVLFEGFATAAPDPVNNALDVQLGINIDGTDYPGTSAVFGTSGSFVYMPLTAEKGIALAAGPHTADLTFRKLGLSVATQALVETNASMPAKLTAVY